MNYVPSNEAAAAGNDFSAKPVGAGPFLLDSYVRDDKLVLVRNPDWYDAPRPYLDRLTIRILPDDEQRLDALLTGDGDASYTNRYDAVARAKDEGKQFQGVSVGTGSALDFNVTRAPFNDRDLREAIIHGIDRQALIEAVQGEGATAPEGYAVADAPWKSAKDVIPDFDSARAQELIDAYLAKSGESKLKFTILGSSSRSVIAEFIQASLNQLKNVDVSVDSVDQATLVTRKLSKDYDAGLWGYPTVYPDPDLFQGISSTSAANVTGFANAEVDKLFEQARTTTDAASRNSMYAKVFEIVATEVPFVPIDHSVNGWITAKQLHIGGLYRDGILRTDLVWKDS